MIIRSLFLSAGLALASFSTAYAAGDYRCPKTLAAIKGDPLSQKATEIFRKVYAKLGCPIKITPLPARRGVLHFNQNLVDGELFRLPLIEPHYINPIARSNEPLFKLTNGLWGRHKSIDPNNNIVGYVKGIAWHDDYLKKHPSTKTVAFASDDQAIAAYFRKSIDFFLSEKQTVTLYLISHGNKRPPYLVQEISALPLYHYLNADYAPFMTAFSKYIKEQKSFAPIE